MKIELDLPQVPEGWRCIGYSVPEEGQGMITGRGDFVICNRENNSTYKTYFLTFERIEPEIDQELEQAKKRFASGWFLWDGRETVLKVCNIMRDTKGHGLLMITSDAGNTYLLNDCIPTTIPTWRCCESDKPKTKGRLYATRLKGNHVVLDSAQFCECGTWGGWLNLKYIANYEWLDEGER